MVLSVGSESSRRKTNNQQDLMCGGCKEVVNMNRSHRLYRHYGISDKTQKESDSKRALPLKHALEAAIKGAKIEPKFCLGDHQLETRAYSVALIGLQVEGTTPGDRLELQAYFCDSRLDDLYTDEEGKMYPYLSCGPFLGKIVCKRTAE